MKRRVFLTVCAALTAGTAMAAERSVLLTSSGLHRISRHQPGDIPPPAPPGVVDPLPPVDAPEGTADVLVEVTYWGKPVADAKIFFRGDNFDLFYDRTLEYEDRTLRERRASGVYLFKDVPYGAYTMELTANVKNRQYVVLRPFSVDDDNRPPGRSFKLQLEKSKDPLMQP